MYCPEGLHMTATSTAHTRAPSSTGTSAHLPVSSVHALAPGQSVWMYLDSGSTLYCLAGQVRVHSLWHHNLLLCAEDAPYCNGAHAGWYQVEALAQQPATLRATQPPPSLWHNVRRTVAEWLGW